MTEEALLWMVIRQDTNGVRYLIEEDLNETDADTRIKVFVDSHTKPHKMDYFKLSYTKKTRALLLVNEQIHY